MACAGEEMIICLAGKDILNMTILMFPLQAAMGLGIVLYQLGILLVFVVLPAVWITRTVRSIRALRKTGEVLTVKTFLLSLLEGLAVAMMAFFAIVLVVLLLLFLFVDLSVS